MHLHNTNNTPHPLREDMTVQALTSKPERLRQVSSYTDNISNELQLSRQIKNARRLDPSQPAEGTQKLGSQGETELYLRSLIEARRAGQLEYPSRDQLVPTAPEVFVVRWVNYQHRYGFGFQLSNSVFGVICNDNVTVVLSPNGDDIEIIHGTANLNSTSGSLPAHQKSRHRKDKEDSSRTASGTPSSKNPPGSNSSNRTIEVEKDEIQPGAAIRATARSTEARSGDTTSSRTAITVRSTSRKVRSATGSVVKALDTYDKLDDEEYLKTLERSYCRMRDFPPLFEKKVALLNNFKDFMLNCLKGTPPWTYVDVDLRRNMPFLTDIFQKVHVVSRLSNGITQVNFADHSKIVLSQRGQVVTFMDNDEKRRRVTLTTRQALSAEFFYDLEDPKDQNRTVLEELKQITHNRAVQDALDQKRERDLFDQNHDGRSEALQSHQHQKRETRPAFNPEKDIDLYLFPRPNLAGQMARASKGMLLSTEYLLEANEDASQIAETPITNDDKKVVIRKMTFKALHTQIVLRLRIAQRLMRDRAMDLAEERLEKEKDGAHPRRRHRSKHPQHLHNEEEDVSSRVKTEPMSEVLEDELYIDRQWENVRIKIEKEEY
ncbi:Cell cycle serine/threonine-protein kinase cdc5/MSD2 [Linnemannia gamsii]|uniref:Cell cycle serine/threonine-protein kinase cdc5/MSD2 n=1 Tax=Linnemannia gamsii TaxID=64522 RepID=A0A9P6R7U5_9FUNG|nr:Cell cycle serine/threonine-protein kinase cdc5/MSD2 [Linnemannia gamsii]